MVLQGLIGYTQFFSHLPPVLVGIHVLGASTVWCAVLWFHHALSEHLPESIGGSSAPEVKPSAYRSEVPASAVAQPLREPV
jgi:cytochrome c oxidase assembly protein subunit 15